MMVRRQETLPLKRTSSNSWSAELSDLCWAESIFRMKRRDPRRLPTVSSPHNSEDGKDPGRLAGMFGKDPG